MLGGHQRAHEVERRAVQLSLVCLGVVALVKDEGDLLQIARQRPIALHRSGRSFGSEFVALSSDDLDIVHFGTRPYHSLISLFEFQ